MALQNPDTKIIKASAIKYASPSPMKIVGASRKQNWRRVVKLTNKLKVSATCMAGQGEQPNATSFGQTVGAFQPTAY